MNPDRLAELEDERRFLLRSLRDLDAELAAGDVDDGDYETLRDGYTKRAADVLRDIEEGKAAPAAARAAAAGRDGSSPPPWCSSSPIGAGWLVARSSGPAARRARDHRRRARDDVAVLLARARALLGVDPAARPGAVRAGARRAARSTPRR